MGEYAETYDGRRIKIGTCEELYYLRFDQRSEIKGYDFSPDVFRYRFPFPDEDAIEAGAFDDPFRGVRIPGGFSLAGEENHGIVQFTATAGYNLCIPCPEQFPDPDEISPLTFKPTRMHVDVPLGDDFKLKVHRNGFRGDPQIVQQRLVDGVLRLVVACGSCGAKWSLSQEGAADVAAAFIEEADRKEFSGRTQDWELRHSEDTRREYAKIAERILAGYTL